MAADRETTKKKDTAKKKDTPKKKATEKKITKPVEKVVEIENVEPVVEEKVIEVEDKKENIEVVNGDPAVLTPKEEEPKKVEKVVEEKETTPKKIIKRISKNFGYFWNGQMIDF